MTKAGETDTPMRDALIAALECHAAKAPVGAEEAARKHVPAAMALERNALAKTVMQDIEAHRRAEER